MLIKSGGLYNCTAEGSKRDYSGKDNLKQHIKQCHSETCDEEEQDHYRVV